MVNKTALCHYRRCRVSYGTVQCHFTNWCLAVWPASLCCF